MPTEERFVLFDESDERILTPVYDRSSLSPGVEFEGPAIIDQLDSTSIVPPNSRASVDEWMNIRIEMEV